MGIYKRGRFWHFAITVNGKLIRGSTGQTNKKKAEEVWTLVADWILSAAETGRPPA